MNKLPLRSAMYIAMHEKGLTYAQIAAICGVNTFTVWRLVRRQIDPEFRAKEHERIRKSQLKRARENRLARSVVVQQYSTGD